MGRKKQLPDIPQEKPETVELTDGAYEWYANDNDTLTTWTGYAAPDWALVLALWMLWPAGHMVWAFGLKETRPKSGSGQAPRRAVPPALIGVKSCRAYMANMPTAAAGGQLGKVSTQTKPPKIIWFYWIPNHAMMLCVQTVCG